jgi:TolA-binding protein
MRLDDLQAAARQLPQHQPTEAQRAALRASLVEAARTEKPAPRRRPLAGAGVVIAAAAAIAFWFARTPEAKEPGARRAAIQSSSGAHFEHTRVPASAGAPVDEVVRLRQGRVAVAVEHLAAGERFRVVTGDAEIEVRGTSFDVVVEGDRLIEVAVHTGLVDVRPAGRPPISLHPGDRWRSNADATALAVASDPDPDPDPDPARGAKSASRAGTRTRRIDPAPPVAADPSPAPATTVPPPEIAPRPVPTATEAAFGRGFRALRRGDYGEAAGQFESAIASGPTSSLADDARYWRGVSLARAGRSAQAQEALGEFLSLHPRSPRAGEASVVLGWLLLESGDRTGAYRRFKAAAGDRNAEVRAGAQKGLARVRAQPSK